MATRKISPHIWIYPSEEEPRLNAAFARARYVRVLLSSLINRFFCRGGGGIGIEFGPLPVKTVNRVALHTAKTIARARTHARIRAARRAPPTSRPTRFPTGPHTTPATNASPPYLRRAHGAPKPSSLRATYQRAHSSIPSSEGGEARGGGLICGRD